MKNNKSGKILNVLLGVIAIFVIIFVIAWLVNRGGKNANVESFNENLTQMQDTAKTYFVNDLPVEIGDSIQLTLEEMYELGLIDELTYGKESCDTKESYISITKINGTEYKVKSNLVCGDKKNSTTEKIEASIEVQDEDGNVIIDSDKVSDKDTKIDVKTDKKTNKSTVTKEDENCKTKINGECKIEAIPAVCTVVYENEFVRRNVSCPSGYVMSNGTCVKESTKNIKATAKYSESYTAHTEAKENPGTEYKVYANPISHPGQTSYYCTEGTLSGDKCIVYANKNTSSSCPSGYTESGDYCYKYANISSNTTYSCPSGYTLSGTTCYKYTNPSSNTTYSCPSGYTQSGSGSSMKCYKTQAASTSCPSGYTESNGTCYKYVNPNNSTKTSCPSGYTPSGNQCVKTSSASKAYTAWGNPTSTYQTNTQESTYTNELTKKVLVGSTSKKVAGKTIYTYTYSIYTRSAYYTCSSGTLSGSLCYHYATPTSSTTYSCPSGYTQSGSGSSMKCYTTTSKSTSCASGWTKSGSTCYYYTTPNTNSSSTCPSGYTKSGSQCVASTSATPTTTTSCPSGYTKSGNTCYIKTNKNTSSSCPSGYSDNGSNCKKTVNAKSSTTPTTYSCPSGYKESGSGSSIKCYKNMRSDSTYYCENANATLVGKTCYYTVEGSLEGYTCPKGYSLKGDRCYKTTTETTSPIWSNAEVIYSESSYVEGYQRTGVIKYTTTCVRTEEVHYK